MKKTLLVAIVALALTGCVTVPPPSEPISVTTPTPQVAEPVQQQPTAEPSSYSPDAFHAAIRPGFVSAAVADAIEDDTLGTGLVLCDTLDSGVGREALIVMAAETLDDPTLFTADMPTIFVDAAITHLCVA